MTRPTAGPTLRVVAAPKLWKVIAMTTAAPKKKPAPGATARSRAAAATREGEAAQATVAAVIAGDAPPPAADVKAEAAGAREVEVLVGGKKWKIELARLDDFELIEDLGRVDAGDMGRLPSALQRVLGPTQYVAAKKALRDPETGRVSLEAGSKFFEDLWAALNPNS